MNELVVISNDFEIKKQRFMQWLGFLIKTCVFTYLFIYACNYGKFVSPMKPQEKPKEIIDLKPVFEEKDISDYKKQMKLKAINLTNKYIGVRGDCYFVSMKYIQELKGITANARIKIKEEDAMAGDLIYYSNNGFETTHFAVYIDEDIAYQPNWNGVAILGKVHYDTFSYPEFYRIIEQEK